MPKGKYGRMPNEGKKGGDMGGSGKAGSNHGKTGGLRKENSQRADVMKKPTTTNRYPNGLS